ncbi:hypothetical protein ABIA69_001247 [Lysinibacillus parviboronicapiens]|uniref:Uncharacterized protein n=1 Tax=Lysinibacillus parviboronicapiens TaxID=436516 RepID=A0ABV2PHE5_9BACI|nr:hypothetical protein [Lysinibacillus parviboronicapiens]
MTSRSQDHCLDIQQSGALLEEHKVAYAALFFFIKLTEQFS